jgi:serine/threonine protein kinase
MFDAISSLFAPKVTISAPQEVRHVAHVDADLNWAFDESVDPKKIFMKLKTIGTGGFGTVSQMVHRPSMKVLAGKLINSGLVDDDTRDDIQAEIRIMREVKSRYTVQYYGSVAYENSLMMLMEYCERGSLRDILDSRRRVLSEAQISIILHDLLNGLHLMHHDHRIIHRDLKAANLLLSRDGGIKIADFGVSGQFDVANCHSITTVGTPYWMAPEVILGTQYSFPADIWSVGITAVELAEGSPPYMELTPQKAMIEISERGFPGYRFPAMHSVEFCDFVSHCAIRNPEERWTIDQLIEHPFVKRGERISREEVLADLLIPHAARTDALGNEVLSHANVNTFDRTVEIVRQTTMRQSILAEAPEEPERPHVVIEVPQESPAPEMGTVPLDDTTFVQVSRVISTRIPFVEMRCGAAPDADTGAIYRPRVITVGDPKKGPIFNEDGVLNLQAALRSKEAPPIFALVLIIFFCFFFGLDGFIGLAAVSLLTNLIVIRLRKMRDDQP